MLLLTVFRIRINLIQIRIQHFRLNTDQDPGSNKQKLKKNYSTKKLNFILIKNYNLPIPRRPERTSKLQKKPPALKRKHLNFLLLLWVIFALLDPDPD